MTAPVITGTRLRGGTAASVRGAASFVAEQINTARQAGATGLLVARMDSAFYNAATIGACRRGGARFSVTARMDPKIRAAIAAIPVQAWTPIRYPNAIFDEHEQRWISDAEVAETTYTAFASRRKNAMTARLIVRRVRRLGPPGQTELTPAWRHHAVFSDSPFPMLIAEADHRDHAIIEQLNADLIDGPLAHLPSVIFSPLIDHGFELGRCVVGSVGDVGRWCLRSAWSDEFHGLSVRRVVPAVPAGDVGGAVLTERAGEGVAELVVVVLEAVDALGCGLQARQQRGLGGALTFGWDSGPRCWSVAAAEPLDLGAQVVLGVEPGPGDSGLAGETVEGDGRAVGVYAPQRGHGSAPGLLGAAPRGCVQVSGVVSRHRMCPSGRVRSRRSCGRGCPGRGCSSRPDGSGRSAARPGSRSGCGRGAREARAGTLAR